VTQNIYRACGTASKAVLISQIATLARVEVFVAARSSVEAGARLHDLLREKGWVFEDYEILPTVLDHDDEMNFLNSSIKYSLARNGYHLRILPLKDISLQGLISSAYSNAVAGATRVRAMQNAPLKQKTSPAGSASSSSARKPLRRLAKTPSATTIVRRGD